MARSADSKNKGSKRRWIERSPKLVFTLAISLIVLPTVFMGVAGSWGLAALEQEPERFYERAETVAKRLVALAQDALPDNPDAFPGVAPRLRPNSDVGSSGMRTVTLEEAYAAQLAQVSDPNAIVMAALTMRGLGEFAAADSITMPTLEERRGVELLHVASPTPRPDLQTPAMLDGLAEAFHSVRASAATTGYYTALSRTRGSGADRMFLLQTYSTKEWNDPQTIWVAWEINLPRLHGLLMTWAMEERAANDDLPIELNVLHWSSPEPDARGVRYMLPLKLDADSLPVWRLSVTLDVAQLPAGRVHWRSLFYAVFAIVMVPGAFLLGVFLYSRLRMEVREARNKVDFVANVTHELRTPLTSIRMFAETLLSGRVRNEEDKREALEVIHQETGRLGRLIDRILEFNKLERQTKIFHFEANDIGEVVASTIKLFQAGEMGRHPGIIVAIEPNLPAVECDRDAMREVLLNLLSNAEKYAGIDTPVHVKVSEAGRYAVIDVTDQGPGIPEAEQAKIFEKFYRANDTLNRKVEGTGLGLAISKAIVKAHRGTISVNSKPGKGATFTVKIPLRRDVPSLASGRFAPVGSPIGGGRSRD